MERGELAILKTVVYADLFDYPLRVEELELGLFDVELTEREIRRLVDESPRLGSVLIEREGFLTLAGREHIVEKRRAGASRAKELLGRYGRVLERIARLPFVRLVALSGAAAFDAVHDDDIDLFVVATKRRAWAACLLVTIVSRLYGSRRGICANYFLDEGSLELADRDLYTAHQLVHLRPLVGRHAYATLIARNTWVSEWFPAGYRAALTRAVPSARVGVSERVSALGLGALLEFVSRKVLTANLLRKIPPGTDPAAVRLGPGRLKLHINDHRPASIARFERRLAEVVEQAERLALCSVASGGAKG